MSENVKENRKMKRFILSKMNAKKRKAFIAKEKFYEEMKKVEQEMASHWRDQVKAVTPEWLRDIALSIPPYWYKTIIDRLSIAIIALGWKWGAWAFSYLFLQSFVSLSKWLYGFGTKTVINTLDDELEMIIYHRGRVLSCRKWTIAGMKDLKISMKGLEGEQKKSCDH